MLFCLLLLPLLALAQSPNVQLSTSLVVEITLGPNRAESTVTRAQVFTITSAPPSSAQPTSTGPSGSASGSNSQSANNANNTAAATATTTTTPRNLPTASIDAGQTHSAPIPGAKEGGGIYGPDDNYISAAPVALTRNTALLGLGALVGGGFVMML